MVLELHVWGPAFGLSSIEPECVAIVAYCRLILSPGQWTLIADYNSSVGANESLPVLFEDGIATATGFEDIVAYLRNHISVAGDLDASLTPQQRTDRTAFITFLQSTATPLIDLSLYVSAENYNTVTSAAYTAILPWYANYTVPPKRRDLARSRTAGLGLSSLNVDTTVEPAFVPGRGTASSEYEAAKRAAGIPTDSQPNPLSMGRGKGIGGLLGGPVYAARFRLDALSQELLEPLSDLLDKRKYLFADDQISSLDCLAFGYLSLLYFPNLPQAWISETIRIKFPRIAAYINRLRQQIYGVEDIVATEVWSNSESVSVEDRPGKLPWRPKSQAISSRVLTCTRELVGNVPFVSSLVKQECVVPLDPAVISSKRSSRLPSPLLVNSVAGVIATCVVGLGALAIHHRRSPRDGELVFWALRPSTGLGEAGNILSVFANQLPRV